MPFEGDENPILFRNILECDPEMPDWLSIISRDLIIKILNPDPDERITLEEIKRHKFYLKGKRLCKINYDDMNAFVKARKLKIDRNKPFMRIHIAFNSDDLDFTIHQLKNSLSNQTYDYYRSSKERGKVIVTFTVPDIKQLCIQIY